MFNHAGISRESAIETDLFISLVVFGVIAAVTPGPNNVMLTSTGLNFGLRRGMPHLLGICIGFPVMLALIGLGFGTLFELYPLMHQVIKVIGVVYLLYLAWKIAGARGGVSQQSRSQPINFWQAAAFQWVNPKAWIMGSSALAAYTSLDDNFFVQVAIVCITFMFITFPCAGVWLVFGAGLQRLLRDAKHLRRFNIAMALLLVASILPVVWDLVSAAAGR